MMHGPDMASPSFSVVLQTILQVNLMKQQSKNYPLKYKNMKLIQSWINLIILEVTHSKVFLIHNQVEKNQKLYEISIWSQGVQWKYGLNIIEAKHNQNRTESFQSPCNMLGLIIIFLQLLKKREMQNINCYCP